MTDKEILEILKTDLQISTNNAGIIKMLEVDIAAARAEMKREGINLTPSIDDGVLIERYAAFLYRHRRDGEGMPRHLRWSLNNRLLSEKARGKDNGRNDNTD